MTREESRQGHNGSRKVKVVCKTCNTGWMSKLEERTKPLLTPLITGDRANLTPEIQLSLATWAAKTVMTADHLFPRDRDITQEERTWMMDNQQPPDKWFVWIGAYNDKDWRNLSIYQQRGALDPSPVAGPSGARYYVQATTFGVGHIVFLNVSSSWPDISKKFEGREAQTHGVFQIWPQQPRSIIWPPHRILRDPQVNGMANILNLSRAFDRSLNPSADWTFTF